jgi:hypothetical protein
MFVPPVRFSRPTSVGYLGRNPHPEINPIQSPVGEEGRPLQPLALCEQCCLLDSHK